MLSSDVRALTFSVRRRMPLPFLWTETFDRREVDDVLTACAEALEAYETGAAPTVLRPDDLVTHQFRNAPMFAEGYDPDEVDDLLDEIVVALRRHQARVAAGGTPEDG